MSKLKRKRKKSLLKKLEEGLNKNYKIIKDYSLINFPILIKEIKEKLKDGKERFKEAIRR